MPSFASIPTSRRILIAVVAVIILFAVLVGIGYLLDPYQFRIAPGVTVGHVDVSGKTFFSATNQLHAAWEESLYSNTLTVQLPEETILISPEDIQPKVNTIKAVFTAYSVGRWQKVPQTEIPLTDYLSVNKNPVLAKLETYAKTWDTTYQDSRWTLIGDEPQLSTVSFDPEAVPQTLEVSMGYPEAHLDITTAWDAISLTFGNAVTTCRDNAYRVVIEVVPTAVPQVPDPQEIAEAVCIAAENDRLDLNTYEFVNGTYGYGFDIKALEKLLEDAEYGQTVTLPLSYIQPEIMGEDVYFRDLLGSYETRHTEDPNRNTNLRLLCEALNGHIVQPGETFSYNQVVGERTAERGYKPAPAYSGTRLVNSTGGGVCQGSTTLYNCVLLADLEVVFRACHGASVGYVPLGLDAAVNYLTTDFQFKNNWHFPVMLQAEVSDGYVKMQILGTDEKDYYIKMESSSAEDEIAVYARSYKCKYSKETNERISRETEAFSTYYKNIG